MNMGDDVIKIDGHGVQITDTQQRIRATRWAATMEYEEFLDKLDAEKIRHSILY